MEPEEIEGREFFVGLRGYDRDEVQTFLAEIAAEMRAARTELDQLRAAGTSADPLEQLGANVTAVLRTANDTAADIVGTAELDAERIRAEADEHVAQVRAEVTAEAESARAALEQARAEAVTMLDEARIEAERERHHAEQLAAETVAAAEARVADLEQAAERAGRERAARAADEIVARRQGVLRQQEELRARLAEANDELQLALIALGDPVADTMQAAHDAAFDVVDLDRAGANE